MASPSVVNTSVFGDSAASTTHAVTLPASIVAGNLLMLSLVIDATGNSITTPAGWTTLVTQNSSGVTSSIIYKTATGSEGATVTVTSTSAKMAAIGYQISGWQGTPENSTVATGGTANPNSGSLTPSWGSADDLFLSVALIHGLVTTSVYPTNYTNGLTQGTTSTNAATVASAQRQLTAASDDPSAFTISAGNSWVAYTVAIQGAVAALNFFPVVSTGVNAPASTGVRATRGMVPIDAFNPTAWGGSRVTGQPWQQLQAVVAPQLPQETFYPSGSWYRGRSIQLAPAVSEAFFAPSQPQENFYPVSWQSKGQTRLAPVVVEQYFAPSQPQELFIARSWQSSARVDLSRQVVRVRFDAPLLPQENFYPSGNWYGSRRVDLSRLAVKLSYWAPPLPQDKFFPLFWPAKIGVDLARFSAAQFTIGRPATFFPVPPEDIDLDPVTASAGASLSGSSNASGRFGGVMRVSASLSGNTGAGASLDQTNASGASLTPKIIRPS
jgi:hypothetical protein